VEGDKREDQLLPGNVIFIRVQMGLLGSDQTVYFGLVPVS
jgi:hypothetical protein